MTEMANPSALKHGAFSEILILPGEDPAAFAALKRSLFEEYEVSGCSEESTMTAIAKTIWQLWRLNVYEHVLHLRAGKSAGHSEKNGKNPVSEAINAFMRKRGLNDPDDKPADVPTVPVQPELKTNDELLLELGNLVTLEHLDKELDVENKLHAKLDRLLKRFFQLKAMKPLIKTGSDPALAGKTAVLALTATHVSELPASRADDAAKPEEA
jgi:hypothetical protein